MIDLEAMKARLSDVPGIETLTLSQIGGRMVAGFDGLIAAVDPSASEDQIVSAIRQASALRPAPMPPVQPQPKGPAMTAPAAGGFAAKIKAMLDQSKARVEQAQATGLAKVNDAVAKLDQAAEHTTRVSDSMAQQINDQADAVLAELGQISNLPPE